MRRNLENLAMIAGFFAILGTAIGLSLAWEFLRAVVWASATHFVGGF